MRRKATFKHIRSGEVGGRTILLTPVITTICMHADLVMTRLV